MYVHTCIGLRCREEARHDRRAALFASLAATYCTDRAPPAVMMAMCMVQSTQSPKIMATKRFNTPSDSRVS